MTVLVTSGALIWHAVHTYRLPPEAAGSAEAPEPVVESLDDVVDAPGGEGEAYDGPGDGAQYADGPAPGTTEAEFVAAKPLGSKDAVPVRIRIPRIGVNAPVKKVALAADGSMDVPKRPYDVAWYAPGPRPGETGSAAMAGHVDWWRGASAVFKDLRKLKPGDKITVQDDIGAVVAFTVRELREYDADADSTDVFTSDDGKAHLNLITCVGAWDKRAKQYSKRLVVFADKVTR